MVVCSIHNHYPVENLKGHSFTDKLSEEEEKLVVNLSKTLVWPRDILNKLKQRNNFNVSKLRIMYNTRQNPKMGQIHGTTNVA